MVTFMLLFVGGGGEGWADRGRMQVEGAYET